MTGPPRSTRGVVAGAGDGQGAQPVQDGDRAQQRVGEDGGMRRRPSATPPGRCRSGRPGRGRASASDDCSSAVQSPPHQCAPAGRQHVGTNSGQRAGRRSPSMPALAQHRAVEPRDPGVEDQRLRRVDRHAAVPVAQQRQRAARGVVGRRNGEQHAAGSGGRSRIARPPACGRSRPGSACRSRSSSSRMRAGAPVAEPVAAEEHREIGRRDAVVGVDQAAARRGRRNAEAGRRSAQPIQSCEPSAGHRSGAVAGAADRHAAGDVQRDAAACRRPAGSGPAR